MATHTSVLAWRIPGTGEPGGLPSMGSHRVGHDWSDLAAAAWQHLAFLSYLTLRSSNILLHWKWKSWGLSQRLPGSSVHEISQARILEWVAISFSRGSSWSRNWTLISTAGRFFTVRATGEAVKKNTGVGSHSLLQGIFLTQESKLGLPHYRQILYHLSHKGSPLLGYLLCLNSVIT